MASLYIIITNLIIINFINSNIFFKSQATEKGEVCFINQEGNFIIWIYI